MARITIIVAADLDNAIGRAQDLLYHIPADLSHFKRLTMGCPVVMGRNTFESLPKGALPGRRNIVVSRNPSYSAPNIETAPGLAEALELTSDAKRVFIIGGGQLYGMAIDLADDIELTRIHAHTPDADTFFPELDPIIWEEISPSESAPDNTTPPISFHHFIRRQPLHF